MSDQDKPTLLDQATILAQLPENQFAAKATTPDGRHVDAQVSAQKSWVNGWGFGTYLRVRFGAGRRGANPEAGIIVNKKLGGTK